MSVGELVGFNENGGPVLEVYLGDVFVLAYHLAEDEDAGDRLRLFAAAIDAQIANDLAGGQSTSIEVAAFALAGGMAAVADVAERCGPNAAIAFVLDGCKVPDLTDDARALLREGRR